MTSLRQRLSDRVYGEIVARWRSGALDDRAFTRAYRLRAQSVIQPVMVLVFLVPAIGDWLSRELSFHDHLQRLPMWGILYGVFALAVGVRVDSFARFGARDELLRRNRRLAEDNPKLDLTGGPPRGSKALTAGAYPVATSYANWVIGVSGGTSALMAAGATFYPRVGIFLVVTVPMIVWGLVLRFDRRVYLDISPDGVWCRAWGKTRFAFTEFKAIYPRQRSHRQGVTLVPRSATALGSRLSWWGRYLLRSGEGVPAHAGTLTIWTTVVGLNRDALMRELQAAIVRP
jgi:hypothetical protein